MSFITVLEALRMSSIEATRAYHASIAERIAAYHCTLCRKREEKTNPNEHHSNDFVTQDARDAFEYSPSIRKCSSSANDDNAEWGHNFCIAIIAESVVYVCIGSYFEAVVKANMFSDTDQLLRSCLTSFHHETPATCFELPVAGHRYKHRQRSCRLREAKSKRSFPRCCADLKVVSGPTRRNLVLTMDDTHSGRRCHRNRLSRTGFVRIAVAVSATLAALQSMERSQWHKRCR